MIYYKRWSNIIVFDDFLKEKAEGFPAAVYMLGYTEEFFFAQALMLLRQGHAELEVFDLDDKVQGVSMRTVVEALNQVSMFCPRPCVVLKNYQKIKKADQTLLARYIDNPSSRSILVLCYSGDSKKVDTRGVKHITLDLKKTALPAWVKERTAHYGIKPSQELIRFICDIYADDLLTLDNELNKLSLLGKKELSLEDACELFYGTKQYSPFQLTKAIAEADVGKAVTIFRGLQEHSEPFVLLGAINWELKKLNLPPKIALRCYELLSDADIQVRANPDYPFELLISGLCSALKRNRPPAR
uniref:DNA polymerase III subunit delta n=1 Tax=Candidatus Magnetobacterium casense TaxID=1455061 RepID=A0A088FCF8_9BACT|nr:DNA polymerase III subunit delta [Candidatus Magnetobacterium casensis]